MSQRSTHKPTPERKYTTVIQSIITLAHPLPPSEIEGKIYAFYEEVCRHLSVHTPELDTDGKYWLSELLAWEELFPDSKDQFPGIRPSPPAFRAIHSGNELPFCECCACMSYPQGDIRCPFIRVEDCVKNSEHGEFKYRIGSMNEGLCPCCEREEGEKEGWVFVDREKGKGKGCVRIIENGWVILEREQGEDGK